MDGDEGEDEECEYDSRDAKEIEDVYESEESAAPDSAGLSVEMTNESKEESIESPSSLPLVCLIPEYATAHIVSLRQLEVMARTTLDKAVSQIDRLVQLYTEINEVRCLQLCRCESGRAQVSLRSINTSVFGLRVVIIIPPTAAYANCLAFVLPLS